MLSREIPASDQMSSTDVVTSSDTVDQSDVVPLNERNGNLEVEEINNHSADDLQRSQFIRLLFKQNYHKLSQSFLKSTQQCA